MDLGDPDRAPLPLALPACPAANAARRISSRHAPGDRGRQPARRRRRRRRSSRRRSARGVGRRTPGTGSSVSSQLRPAGPLDPRAAPVLPGADPGLRRAVEGARGAEPRASLEARRGVEAPVEADQRVDRRVRRVGRDRHPAVDVPRAARRAARRRARGRARRRRDRARARSRRRRATGRGGTGRRRSCAGRRRSSAAVVRPAARARRSPAGAAPRSRGRRESRSSRMPAVIVGPGFWATMIRTLSARTSSQVELEPVAPLADRVAASGDLDRGDLHARVVVRPQIDVRDVARRAEARPSGRGGRASARDRPASASPGRRRARRTAGSPGTADSRATTARSRP